MIFSAREIKLAKKFARDVGIDEKCVGLNDGLLTLTYYGVEDHTFTICVDKEGVYVEEVHDESEPIQHREEDWPEGEQWARWARACLQPLGFDTKWAKVAGCYLDM